ncbi:hypothetical protein EP7_001337 [Isosphaeraceae bacterium EP7]
MPPTSPNAASRDDAGADDPWLFLVGTDGHDRDILDIHGGDARASRMMLQVLGPALELLGRWRTIERPSSSLPFVASKAKKDGMRPVHVSLRHPHETYLTPASPTVILCNWPFPDVPGRAFGIDTRHHWPRILAHTDLLAGTSRRSAKAFREADLPCPVAHVPIPAPSATDAPPPWSTDASWTLDCCHVVINGGQQHISSVATDPYEPSEESAFVPPRPRLGSRIRHKATQIAKSGCGKVEQTMPAGVRARFVKTKGAVVRLPWNSPRRLPVAVLRKVYGRYCAGKLDSRLHARLVWLKRAMRRIEGPVPVASVHVEPSLPPIPSAPLTLSGITYTAILDVMDPREDVSSLLESFVRAFALRPDVTLVIKVLTSPLAAPHAVHLMRHLLHVMGIPALCRIVAVTDDIDEKALLGVTTYHVDSSKARGGALGLRRALAWGRPALAPTHTGLAELIDDRVGFSVSSAPEPASFPRDHERRGETTWFQVSVDDLSARLVESLALVEDGSESYAEMCRCAAEKMAEQFSPERTAEALGRALETLVEARPGAMAWSC